MTAVKLPRLRVRFSLNSSASLTLQQVVLQLASTTNQGMPKIQPIIFYDFKDADQRILIFSAATRNSDLMSVVKHSQSHQLYWQFPKTKETFTFTGRIYIVAAPTMSHRFGTPPRRISLSIDKSINADDYWEDLRIKAWKSLSSSYRATFTWPAPGEAMSPTIRQSWSVYRDPIIKAPPPTIETGYSYTKLEAIDDSKISKSATLSRFTGTISRMPTLQRSFSTGTDIETSRLPAAVIAAGTKSKVPVGLDKEEELRSIHNSALDNFSLLVFKCSSVEHVVPGLIPARTLYSSDKNGFCWSSLFKQKPVLHSCVESFEIEIDDHPTFQGAEDVTGGTDLSGVVKLNLSDNLDNVVKVTVTLCGMRRLKNYSFQNSSSSMQTSPYALDRTPEARAETGAATVGRSGIPKSDDRAELILVGDNIVWRGKDTSNHEHPAVLNAGQHEWRIYFKLPGNLPKTVPGDVAYTIRAAILRVVPTNTATVDVCDIEIVEEVIVRRVIRNEPSADPVPGYSESDFGSQESIGTNEDEPPAYI
ncbi:hypothetical protein HK096_010150 [Nowakowskiella sp. JEL0078]|nr:hypothetical protein HK096_010150 [Nowakowskiella sp. JEL0078]